MKTWVIVPLYESQMFYNLSEYFFKIFFYIPDFFCYDNYIAPLRIRNLNYLKTGIDNQSFKLCRC